MTGPTPEPSRQHHWKAGCFGNGHVRFGGRPRGKGPTRAPRRAVDPTHYIRDVTFAEDASTVHNGTAPRAMAAFRNLVIGALKILGADNIAKTTRAIGE